MNERMIGAAFTVGGAVVSALPERVAAAAFRAGADLQFRRGGPAVVQLARNLHRVLGRQSTPQRLAEVTRLAVRSYARYWQETLRLESMDTDAVYESVEANSTGMEHIDRAVGQGRGVVIALPHTGNWDIAGFWVSRRWGGMTTVAERLEPESMYRRFVAYREYLGMEVLPLTGGDVSVSGVLKERLRAGGIVCLLADRDLSRAGVPVTFFSEQTRMPAGPAMLAAVTGADLCTVKLNYTDTGWQQFINSPLELPGKRLRDKVSGGTQLMADQFAGYIAQHPQDWHMMQPLWLDDLSEQRRLRLDSDPGGRR